MVHITHATKPVSAKSISMQYHLLDVKGRILGRVANEIAHLLQGKHKINYVPHLDMGDAVVVINAKHVLVTGKKREDKTYARYSGYPGGLKTINFKALIDKQPQTVITHAVSGMLPKNKLRDRRLAKLHVFSGAKHPFAEKIESKS